MSKRCGWFLIAGALIASGSAMADVRYTFDFSGSDLTSGRRVVVSYTAPTPTPAGAVLRGVTQSPKLNSRVHGTRHRNGVWRFNGFGDAHFSYVLTAYAGLMISHAPGIYANIPASTEFTCSGECGGRRTGSTAGTVTIRSNPPKVVLRRVRRMK